MIEKDNIRDLFSKTLENHTSPVRPEVWNGLQAKMAAAGVSSAAAGAKGISMLAKWLIGSAAVSVAAVTTVVLVNQGNAPVKAEKAKQETTAVLQPETSTDSPAATTTAPGTATSDVLQSTQSPVTITIPEPHIGTEPVTGLRAILPLTLGGGATPEGEPGTAIGEPKGSEGNPVIGKTTPADQHIPENRTTTSPAVNEPAPAAEASEAKITLIPNVFTPNNDGSNDHFYIESQNLKSFSVSFYDNNNNSVWRSEDPNFRWDGTSMSGEPVPAGLYGCMILARDAKGNLIKEYRNIEIRR